VNGISTQLKKTTSLLVGNGLLVVASVPVTGSVLFISAVTGSVTSIVLGLDPVFRTAPLLYHKFGNQVIFRLGNLYSLCSPGKQDYHKIIHS